MILLIRRKFLWESFLFQFLKEIWCTIEKGLDTSPTRTKLHDWLKYLGTFPCPINLLYEDMSNNHLSKNIQAFFKPCPLNIDASVIFITFWSKTF